MESVRLKINEHMTSVGEDILCVLENKQQSVDVCSVTLDVRVFVLGRLTEAARFLCNLFQREIENIKLHTADAVQLPVCKEVFTEQQKTSFGLVQELQEEPQPPQIKERHEELLQRLQEADWSTSTLLAVRSELSEDDRYNENRDTEPVVASTSTQHMKTQAGVEDCGTSQPTSDNQLLSSHCSKSDTGDGDDTMRSHTGKKIFSCTECGKCFDVKLYLTRHTRIHTGEKPFTCNVCGKGFCKKGVLKVHMLYHSGEMPFTCNVCGKGCPHRSLLKIHMMTHTGEKPLTCNVCGKGCINSTRLRTHMRIHTGEKPYTCTVCGKGFAQNCLRTLHMRTHTGEKPFTCSVCGKAFAQNSILKAHIRTHTGEKPFTCSVCGYGCAQRSGLKIHMGTHTGEKLFACDICGKSYRSRTNLNGHMLTKKHKWKSSQTHEEKLCTCDICGKVFSRRSNLNRHVMKTHKREKTREDSHKGETL